MKNLCRIFLPCVFLLSLCGCSGRPTGLFFPANLDLSAEVELAEAVTFSDSTDNMPANPTSAVCLIASSYPWGSSFDTILDAETEEGQLPGTDYGYFEEAEPYARELVFRVERDGHSWHCYYDFDTQDRLVSSMLMLRDDMSARETIKLFLTFAEEFSDRYGTELRGLDIQGDAVEGVLSSPEETEGPILAEWRDAEGNQLLLEFRFSISGRPELYITCSEAAWASAPG